MPCLTLGVRGYDAVLIVVTLHPYISGRNARTGYTGDLRQTDSLLERADLRTDESIGLGQRVAVIHQRFGLCRTSHGKEKRHLDNAYIAKAAQHIPAICKGLGITCRIISDNSTVTIGERPSIGDTMTALP